MKLRLARREDVPAIVRLLADDQLGAQRERLEDPMPDVYWRAFDVIDGDPNNELVVADRAGEVLACLQITYIPYLSRGGSWRAQIEAVRVSKAVRREGIGRLIVEWAMARARDKGCTLAQLTTDKRRPDAHRFYDSLGFDASHEGMKLVL